MPTISFVHFNFFRLKFRLNVDEFWHSRVCTKNTHMNRSLHRIRAKKIERIVMTNSLDEIVAPTARFHFWLSLQMSCCCFGSFSRLQIQSSQSVDDNTHALIHFAHWNLWRIHLCLWCTWTMNKQQKKSAAVVIYFSSFRLGRRDIRTSRAQRSGIGFRSYSYFVPCATQNAGRHRKRR